MTFEQDLEGVAALGGVHGIEPEVVEDQDIDGEEASQLGFVGAIEAGVLEGFEHRVGAQREDREGSSASDVSACSCSALRR